jgi:hypothetical protein
MAEQLERRWTGDQRKTYCIGWAELNTEQESIFWRWAEENDLLGWLAFQYPCQTELYYGSVTPTTDHGPDADEASEDG